MRNNKQIMLAAFAVVGLFAASAERVQAGEPGIVRISDSPNTPGAVQARTISTSAATISYGHAGCANCNGSGCNSCNSGRCSLCKLLHSHCLCSNSPDHGWGRPVKRPINRLPVLYQRYWPNAWNGQPGAGYASAGKNYYPSVYMPTDTTQLGYYYQGVPFWRPNPGMTPPVPWPGQWHRRECQTNQCGSGAYGQPAYGYGSGIAPSLRPVPKASGTPADSEDAPPAPKDQNETAFNVIR